MIGAMFSDGECVWEVTGRDGTDPRGGRAWIVSDVRDDLALRPRDRRSKRVTQDELDRMRRLGFGTVDSGADR
jgi:hypothetical protein